MSHSFGPWATAMTSNAAAGLSGFWRRRMSRLATLPGLSRKPPRVAALVAITLLVTPTVFPTAPAADPPAAEPPRKEADRKPDETLTARAAFERRYALTGDEVFKCFKPPAPERIAYYWEVYRQEPWDRAEVMVWLARTGRLERRAGDPERFDHWVNTRNDHKPIPLEEVLANVFRPLRLCEIDGPRELLQDRGLFQADFVVRKDAPRDKLAERLGAALREDFGIPVKLSYREAEREVVVARGKYRYAPVPGLADPYPLQPGDQIIRISGHRAAWDKGSFANAGLQGVFDQLGVCIGRPVVGEVEGPVENARIWHFTPGVRGGLAGEAGAVLKRVAKQTGLTFSTEKRRGPVLTVEKAN
jgi:hypothetical protein